MKPYYRVYCTPLLPQPGSIDCDDPAIRELVHKPPETRHGGWTLWSAREIRRTPEGLEALGLDDRRLILLTNGHIEFWMPCLDETFQWGQAESERKLHPWLYDYPVCELPVNFMRLAKAVYDHAQLDDGIIAGEGFYAIKGFILMPYGPRTMAYHMPSKSGVPRYQLEDLQTVPVQASKDFVPDHVAYDMVTQVYSAFGYRSDDIRLFDENHCFQSL